MGDGDRREVSLLRKSPIIMSQTSCQTNIRKRSVCPRFPRFPSPISHSVRGDSLRKVGCGDTVPEFPSSINCRDTVTTLWTSNRLDSFQANFAFLLGAGFADPDHPAALGVGHVFIEDKFDNLTAPEVETSTHAETFFRRIDDEAGESLCLAVQIDD